MATYKTIDLINQISQILNDGYHFVDVYEDEADDDYPASLSFEVPDFDMEYDEVISLSDDTTKLTISSQDYIAAFTLEEITLLHQAVSNALEYYKECQKDSSYSRDDKASIKSASVKTRNMQAKLLKIINSFQ